jgi:hypothetical protein
MAVEPYAQYPYAPPPLLGAQPAARIPPPRYFDFASPSGKHREHANGISAQRIRGRCGFNVNESTIHNYREAFSVAKQLGVRMHAYLGGPCGPTGSKISPDEYAYMQKTSRALGINTNSQDWMGQWNSWGWKEATKRQLKVIKQLGFESYEIDNLERDRKIGSSKSGIVDFYREAAQWDGPPKIMMKNLSVRNLQDVESAMSDGRLQRSKFADFHISEEDFKGQWPQLERASGRMGIQLARSHDTHNYACSTDYKPGLLGAVNQFLTGVGNFVGGVVKGVASLFGIQTQTPPPEHQPDHRYGSSQQGHNIHTAYRADAANIQRYMAAAPSHAPQQPAAVYRAPLPVPQGVNTPPAVSDWRNYAPDKSQPVTPPPPHQRKSV